MAKRRRPKSSPHRATPRPKPAGGQVSGKAPGGGQVAGAGKASGKAPGAGKASGAAKASGAGEASAGVGGSGVVGGSGAGREGAGTGGTGTVGPVPRLRAVAAGLVALEALFLLGYTVFLVVETVVATAADSGGAVALAAVTLVLGIGVGVCAWGVWSGGRWSRAPVVTWQIIQAGVAMPLSTSSAGWYVGIPLLALSVVVLVLMISRAAFPPEES